MLTVSKKGKYVPVSTFQKMQVIKCSTTVLTLQEIRLVKSWSIRTLRQK